MPELRQDPIQKQWVIIASERSRRPQDYASPRQDKPPRYCPFCPGNEEKTPDPIRIYGSHGPIEPGENWTIRVLPNKYPALQVEGGLNRRGEGLYDRINGIGAHEVIVETPEHDSQLADLSAEHFGWLMEAYRERISDLNRDIRLRYVMIFKNYGAAAGATVDHPHSQVIAMPVTPRVVSTELRSAMDHYHLKERCLFCDIIEQEIRDEKRIVALDEHYVALCPYASRFPFEVHILPRKHSSDFSKENRLSMDRLALMLSDVLGRIRGALDDPPYNLVVHTSPNPSSGKKKPGYWNTLALDYHWHIEIFPRLSRLAGFETGTGFYINPVAPEIAAAYLRELIT